MHPKNVLVYTFCIDDYIEQYNTPCPAHMEKSLKVGDNNYYVGLGKMKFQLFHEDDYACLWCCYRATHVKLWQVANQEDKYFVHFHTVNGRILTIDHVIPRAKGGSNKRKNLQTLCNSCNGLKSDFPTKPTVLVKASPEKNGRHRELLVATDGQVFPTHSYAQVMRKYKVFLARPNAVLNIQVKEFERLRRQMKDV